ncbi:uncharacterized protein AAEQ78_015192 [Lycaon pictus]
MGRPATQAARCSWDRRRAGRAGSGRTRAGADSPAAGPGAQGQAGPGQPSAEQLPRSPAPAPAPRRAAAAWDSLRRGRPPARRPLRTTGAGCGASRGLSLAGRSAPHPPLDGSSLRAGRAYRGGTRRLLAGRGALPRTSSLPASGSRPCGPRGKERRGAEAGSRCGRVVRTRSSRPSRCSENRRAGLSEQEADFTCAVRVTLHEEVPRQIKALTFCLVTMMMYYGSSSSSSSSRRLDLLGSMSLQQGNV